MAYAYNAQGIRTAKRVNNLRTAYLLDGGNVVAEVQNNTVTDNYLRGANLIRRTSSSETEYYLFNAHGDVVTTTNLNGTVNQSYDYDAFGNEKNPDALDTNPFRYCGEYLDFETGAYYLRARYYDPTIGRFTQQDTHWNTANMIYGDNPQKINEREDKLGLKTCTIAPQIKAVMQSGNLYVYGVNCPCSYVDPTGEIVITATTLLVAGCIFVFGTAGGIIGGNIADANGATGWERLLCVAVGTVIGSVGGVFLGQAAAPTTLVTALGGTGVASAPQLVQQIEPAFREFTQRNFRFNLQQLTGEIGEGLQAHHVLPQKFEEFFTQVGLNIHNPIFGSWVDSSHQSWSMAYNKAWEEFFRTIGSPSIQQILQKAKELAEQFGFKVYFK